MSADLERVIKRLLIVHKIGYITVVCNEHCVKIVLNFEI